jgi:hypothetical protein
MNNGTVSWLSFLIFTSLQTNSNMTSFFRFVDKRAIYRWYNLIRTCAGECDWLYHWQHKLCATLSANVSINYRLTIKISIVLILIIWYLNINRITKTNNFTMWTLSSFGSLRHSHDCKNNNTTKTSSIGCFSEFFIF